MKALTGISLISLSAVVWAAIIIVAGQSMQTAKIREVVSDPFGFPIQEPNRSSIRRSKGQFHGIADKRVLQHQQPTCRTVQGIG